MNEGRCDERLKVLFGFRVQFWYSIMWPCWYNPTFIFVHVSLNCSGINHVLKRLWALVKLRLLQYKLLVYNFLGGLRLSARRTHHVCVCEYISASGLRVHLATEYILVAGSHATFFFTLFRRRKYPCGPRSCSITPSSDYVRLHESVDRQSVRW
jgi:hypothetical protein